MPSSHLILYYPLLLLPQVPPSIKVFSNESALCIRWPKYWSFSFNISPSNEHSGLISFRMDWLDLLAEQGALKSLLQHHSSEALILWHLAFFIVQLSATPRTAAYQAPPSMGFPRQEYWSGVPLPSPMTNLDIILKSRDIALPTKFCLVKAMVYQWSCMDVRVGL